MKVVMATQAALLAVLAFTAVDAEGNEIQGVTTDENGKTELNKAFKAVWRTDNDLVINVTPPEGGNDDGSAATIGFGVVGTANLNVQIFRVSDGELLGSFGEQFTLVAGDPEKLATGGITIAGLE